MYIEKINLQNFRGFESESIELNGKSTIFYGNNGLGKSSILRSIDLIFANLIAKVLNKRKKLAELTEDDIHFGSKYASIELECVYDDESRHLCASKIDVNGKKNHFNKALTEFADSFVQCYIGKVVEDKDGDGHMEYLKKQMPIFVNYGVNRLVSENSIDSVTRQYNRLDAFENAIESRIDFKGFFAWFKQQEDLENELIARNGLDNKTALPVLDEVRKAMLSMFPDFHNVRFDRRLNTLNFEKGDIRLNINQLSDGEKCTIALFGDIARRLAIAADNEVNNPLEGSGVVLIDELDLHLHPLWQRQIVGILRKTFPNIQFIITTHSPQVLGGIDSDFNIFKIDKGNDGIRIIRQNSLYGWDTNIVLEEAMDVAKLAPEVSEIIHEMYEAYENGNLELAEEKADLIDEITNGHNDCVSGIRMLISRKKRKQIDAKSN